MNVAACKHKITNLQFQHQQGIVAGVALCLAHLGPNSRPLIAAWLTRVAMVPYRKIGQEEKQEDRYFLCWAMVGEYDLLYILWNRAQRRRQHYVLVLGYMNL